MIINLNLRGRSVCWCKKDTWKDTAGELVVNVTFKHKLSFFRISIHFPLLFFNLKFVTSKPTIPSFIVHRVEIADVHCYSTKNAY